MVRLRVRQGHIQHNGVRREQGYEFVVPEKDAAEVMRHAYGRRNFEIVEVVPDEATPPQEPRARE